MTINLTMKRITRQNILFLGLALVWVSVIGLSSCEKSKSYSELLRREERAVNSFLATQKVENNIPEDSISFIMGKDAPFYRIDPDGYVYMQVISKGDMDDRVENGDKVYFRMDGEDLLALYQGREGEDFGNGTNVGSGNNYFVYGNNVLTSSTQWGTGIQLPLKFFGYNCEVNLVLRSYYGFSSNITTCIPYLLNVKYFKPEY